MELLLGLLLHKNDLSWMQDDLPQSNIFGLEMKQVTEIFEHTMEIHVMTLTNQTFIIYLIEDGSLSISKQHRNRTKECLYMRAFTCIDYA
jgi:hypothetical protein